MMRLYLCLFSLLVLSGCAGRSDMRAVASQSSAIMNQAQIEATRYAEAQTRYEAIGQANIASFSKMTAIGNQEAEAVQTTWVDSSMSSLYSGVKPRSLADYQKVIDDATAAPLAPTAITIDTSKVRSVVAQLNELAKEENLESRVAFLTMFAKTVSAAYQDAQKKAAAQANEAANDMKTSSPVQQ